MHEFQENRTAAANNLSPTSIPLPISPLLSITSISPTSSTLPLLNSSPNLPVFNPNVAATTFTHYFSPQSTSDYTTNPLMKETSNEDASSIGESSVVFGNSSSIDAIDYPNNEKAAVSTTHANLRYDETSDSNLNLFSKVLDTSFPVLSKHSTGIFNQGSFSYSGLAINAGKHHISFHESNQSAAFSSSREFYPKQASVTEPKFVTSCFSNAPQILPCGTQTTNTIFTDSYSCLNSSRSEQPIEADFKFSTSSFHDPAEAFPVSTQSSTSIFSNSYYPHRYSFANATTMTTPISSSAVFNQYGSDKITYSDQHMTPISSVFESGATESFDPLLENVRGIFVSYLELFVFDPL